ncbi:MAG: hypothetical protein M3R17_14485 [Bacteroidota bacterium]|nr:hypothetical protein [Bacteroidota bacterium]
MKNKPGFDIKPDGPISKEFLDRNIQTFTEAAEFVQHLPYHRNKNKTDLSTVFTDNCGTCSTKHGVLKLLANENNFEGLELVIGLFKMNATNTPAIAKTLEENQLDYIPEAHCYLKFNNEIMDFTKPDFKPANYINELIEEFIIAPTQVNDFKVSYHKDYLTKWLAENKTRLSPDEIWAIREQCIRDLS